MFIDPDNPLAAEILLEAGEAYFAGCKKMLVALDALKAFENAATPATRDADWCARRSRMLDDAAERVYFVLVQRDAMQLSGSEWFLHDYEVPAEVVAQMGKLQRE